MKDLCCISKALLFLSVMVSTAAFSQEKSISITIDDVPNTTKYLKDNFHPTLLNVLDSLDIPFTIFINEDKIFITEFRKENKELLDLWIKNKQSITGNHTYSHSSYSEVGFDSFLQDIEQGEKLTRQYASNQNKELKYFRFPFNDMGMDSVQHKQIREFLKSKTYIIAPFTVESSDWMFDAVYQHYLDNEELDKAREIGTLYVEKTLEMMRFFEEMSLSLYKRPIKHIYLCHDNAINTDYLGKIISSLKQDGYQIVSFEESLTDPVYSQEDTYYKKWGISWLYRWMDTQEERVKWMKQEPDLSEIQIVYNEITKK